MHALQALAARSCTQNVPQLQRVCEWRMTCWMPAKLRRPSQGGLLMYITQHHHRLLYECNRVFQVGPAGVLDDSGYRISLPIYIHVPRSGIMPDALDTSQLCKEAYTDRIQPCTLSGLTISRRKFSGTNCPTAAQVHMTWAVLRDGLKGHPNVKDGMPVLKSPLLQRY